MNKKEAEDALGRLQHLFIDHGCSNTLAAITEGVDLIEAAHAVGHRVDLEELREELPEAKEIFELLGEFVEDANERGCAAAAFDLLFHVCLFAAEVAMDEEETQIAGQRTPTRPSPSPVIN